MQKKIQTVNTLLDALPFIKKFSNEVVVIKYGGSAQINSNLKKKFAEDILLLHLIGIKPVIVHGGGKSITRLLDELNIKTEFKNGLRVTDENSIKIAEMVLKGEINSEIVSLLNEYEVKAIGISGKDLSCIKADAIDFDNLGYTGKITHIDSKVIKNLIDEKFTPVIAPIATANQKEHPGFNINADLVASQVAIALNAKKVIFLTDTLGVLDKQKNLLSSINKEQIQKLKENKTIIGGMIPKVDACLEAIDKGVEKAHIIDGRIEHSILLELFTKDGIGTEIYQ